MPQSTRVFWTIQLDDVMASAADWAGAKAANLARAARHDLPVLPGFVIPVRSDTTSAEADGDRYLHTGELREAWAKLSRGGEIPLVVRSSSTMEDGVVSSMAGRFVSVLDVTGWEPFLTAVGAVQESSSAPGTMAVLVQPQLTAAAGGVMFGADPVDGRTDRVIVSAVPGGPQALVGGEVNGTRYALTRRGRVISVEHDDGRSTGDSGDTGEVDQGPLTRMQLRALARLAAKAAAVFGGPQDVEFAFDHDGRLWLLQSRPVTALAPVPPRRATLLGPGPVAETLPDPLAPLEEDLWLAPLNHGIGEALATAGAVSRRALRKSPTVLAVGGRAAADLQRLGAAPGRRSRLRMLNPVPAVRRLSVAWRVGRLRADLPDLAAQTAAAVDADLAAVPPLAEITDAQLIAALRWTRAALAALHGQEALAGSLLSEGTGGDTGSAAAQGLAALHRGRSRGQDDAQLLAAEPTVLALTPPAITSAPRLPAVTADPLDPPAVTGTLPPREILRLRIRWVQELGARLAWAAGQRLTASGVLPSPELVRTLRFDELDNALTSGATIDRRPVPPPRSAPLPTVFRLAGDRIVAEAAPTGDGARPAGGGRGSGPVHSGPDAPPAGSVLVVDTLRPSLATSLPKLAGLVAETGSPLSHLAILARELNVPTVVGLRGALDRFPPGTDLLVDGDTGRVEILALVADQRPDEESVA
ncbi:PEP/pyruvate-binding domain-containing protein [Actinomadura rudentiformis]|uniref:PEP/pyruvate-binding domain-containing protein n=1 Tax=Actinomadura rudentiformis TaxID=359158 RepID=UPI00178C4699|nr:PEP/pyruvate-binding domain-containing protein [Actinomadura rudentiformis]